MRLQDLFEMKQCTHCGECKSINEFSKATTAKDGLQDRCKVCNKRQNDLMNPKTNCERMWVNGKYIPKSHPLHKPGRYRTFEDAAFSSLAKYETSVEGQVYIIHNPNFEGWVKVGMAVDSQDRLNGYQTSSPFRDYELYRCWDVSDRRATEAEAHAELAKVYERRGEWFNCTPEQAQAIVEVVVQEEV